MRKLTNAFYKIYTGFSVITGELPMYFYMNNAIRFYLAKDALFLNKFNMFDAHRHRAMPQNVQYAFVHKLDTKFSVQYC